MIEVHGGQRILVGTPALLRAVCYQNGVPADPGATTATIRGLDGSLVVEDAPATVDAETGMATVAIDAEHTADLDVWTVTWSTANLGTLRTTAEIVGAHLFTIAEARAFDQEAMEALSLYPVDAITDARRRIEDAFEEICHVSFIPRVKRQVYSGSYGKGVILPLGVTAIRSVEERFGDTWVANDPELVAEIVIEPWGGLFWSTGIPVQAARQLRITYEYGYPEPPLEIKRAGLWLLRDSLVSSNIDPRAMSYTDGMATIRFVTPGLSRGAWFSVPEVNATLQRYVKRIPGIA